MNNNTIDSSTGDRNKPLCITCGLILPTPVSSTESETVEIPLPPSVVPEPEEQPAKRSHAAVAEPEKVIKQ